MLRMYHTAQDTTYPPSKATYPISSPIPHSGHGNRDGGGCPVSSKPRCLFLSIRNDRWTTRGAQHRLACPSDDRPTHCFSYTYIPSPSIRWALKPNGTIFRSFGVDTKCFFPDFHPPKTIHPQIVKSRVSRCSLAFICSIGAFPSSQRGFINGEVIARPASSALCRPIFQTEARLFISV